MKVRVTEVRVYDLTGALEPDIRAAIRRNDIPQLDEFLCDLSDCPAESIDTVKVEVVRGTTGGEE